MGTTNINRRGLLGLTMWGLSGLGGLSELSEIRWDGTYSSFDGAMFRHLRFFPSGDVIFTLTSGASTEIRGWFNFDHRHKSGGRYIVDSGVVYFTITSIHGKTPPVIVDYQGPASHGELTLATYSHYTNWSGKRTYTFESDF